MLELVEDPLARPAGRHAGLYHYALLYPTREELARAAIRLSVTQTPIDGASDHRTHEAIYLPDPDGNGIELAADRPPRRGRPTSATPAAPPRWTSTRCWRRSRVRTPRPRSARACAWATCTCTWVTSSRASRFYRDVLGFEVQANLGQRGVRERRRLPPPPRLQHLARPGRRPRARAHRRPAPLDRRRPGADEVRARVDDAEDIPGGFLTRDPWGTAVAFLQGV